MQRFSDFPDYNDLPTSREKQVNRDRMNERMNNYNESDIRSFRRGSHYKQNDDSHNVDRLMMERDTMFGFQSRNDNIGKPNGRKHSYRDPGLYGEITGQVYTNDNQLDTGMPLRPFMDDIKKPHYDDYHDSSMNPALDFDLYDHKANLNVQYYDPTNVGAVTDMAFTDISELGNHGILEISNTSFSDTINQFASYLITEFLVNMKRKREFVLSPYTMLNQMTSLYNSSVKGTEKELREILFSNTDKNSIFSYFNKLNKGLSSKMVVTKSMIAIPNNYVINEEYANRIRSLAYVYPIDMSRGQREVNNINTYFKSAILEPHILNRQTGIILLSSLNIHCFWKHSFAKVLRRHFYGLDNKRVELMMIQKKKEHLYYTDNHFKFLEIDMQDDKLSMGFILSKDKKDTILNEEEINDYLTHLSPVSLDLILIPKFKHQTKFKLDAIYKKLGVQQVFRNAELPKLINRGNKPYVSDIIQQVSITVSDEGEYMYDSLPDLVTSRGDSFVADKPFIYYIRYKPLNVIIALGKYF